MSTFHGLEMAKQALFVQQSALYTTGHNISNANTPGYSRQRVNFATMPPFPAASLNRPGIPGQMGNGVKAESVERIRDRFLDIQYRMENSKSEYWKTMSAALGRMENLMNETKETGLTKAMNLFWDSLQDLALHPNNSGARSVVAKRGQAIAETFNYFSKSLNSIRSDLENQMDASVTKTNSLLRQINEINKQIKQIEPHGYLPNDLYDERDRLIDELSGIVNIKVTMSPSGNSAPDIAEGLASIELLNDNGQPLGITLLDATAAPGDEVTGFQYTPGDPANNIPAEITVAGQKLPLPGVHVTGSLNALVNAYSTDFVDVLADLDKMAKALIDEFNKIHAEGYDLEGNNGVAFFTGSDAGTIAVNQAIIDDPDLIAASADGTSGNGDNALHLADVFNNRSVGLGQNTSIKSFYESMIGVMGVKAQEANRNKDNTEILLSQVEFQRMAVSSVSLDEEITNMIKFQHAYNAAARSMTAVDEMLDRIINNMGLVGR